jgi:hypothetical protein
MTGTIAAILLGLASIAFWSRMMSVGRNLASAAEKKLWQKWLAACCLGLSFALLVPGALEMTGVIPPGTVGCAGAVLCFILIVRSGRRYRQRLSRLRRENQIAGLGLFSPYTGDADHD